MIPRGADRRVRGAAALLLALVAAAGCAKNPVSGRRQLMLITEAQELAIGEGADKEIRKEHGSYLDSPALRSYVDRVGSSLARRGERPELVFHFEVLNTPALNAFALPGGFVYVTRGMIERLSTEDELAMVLGHEVGHVTARHGAARISQIYALQYGTLLGAVISPRTLGSYGDLINIALNVALSKYSREQESQADRLGIDYAVEAGYQPEGGVTVMKILKWMEGREPGALEKWFLSHPPADERIADIRSGLRALEEKDPAIARRAYQREGYLRQVDGLIVGPYNGSEMVLRDRYYNKELAISMGVPDGWEVDLDPNGPLVVMSSKAKEVLRLESRPMHAATEAAGVERDFEKDLKRRGLKRTGGRQARTGQEVAVHLATYEGRSPKGEPIGVQAGFLVRGKHEWIATGAGQKADFEQNRSRYEEAILGVAFLEEAEAAALQPPRLRVAAAPPGADWPSLAREHLGSAEQAERLAFYNGLDPNAPVAAGTLLKLPPSLSVKP